MDICHINRWSAVSLCVCGCLCVCYTLMKLAKETSYGHLKIRGRYCAVYVTIEELIKLYAFTIIVALFYALVSSHASVGTRTHACIYTYIVRVCSLCIFSNSLVAVRTGICNVMSCLQYAERRPSDLAGWYLHYDVLLASPIFLPPCLPSSTIHSLPP